MKNFKYLVVVFALFAVSAMQAQAQVRFGVKGGVNFASANFDKKMFDSDGITGFQVGPSIEAMFNKGLGLDFSVLYSQKGFGSESETARNAFLDIPLNLKLKLGIEKFNPYFAAGPYVSFRVAGDKIWDVKDNAQGIKTQVKTKGFGAGLNLGAGVELFDYFQLGFVYSWGLTDNYETFDAKSTDSYKGKTRTLSVVATILF